MVEVICLEFITELPVGFLGGYVPQAKPDGSVKRYWNMRVLHSLTNWVVTSGLG